MRLRDRLVALEANAGCQSGRWHRILQDVGQSFDEARARYELRNGPVSDGDNLIVRSVVRSTIAP